MVETAYSLSTDKATEHRGIARDGSPTANIARNKEENNMKNQRILSAALAVLMAGSLAACGGGAAGSTPASDTTDTSSAASASQAAPVDEYKQYKGGDVVLATDSVFNNFFTPYQAGNAIAWGSFCMEPLGKKIQGTADDYDLVLAESFDVDEENFLVKR